MTTASRHRSRGPLLVAALLLAVAGIGYFLGHRRAAARDAVTPPPTHAGVGPAAGADLVDDRAGDGARGNRPGPGATAPLPAPSGVATGGAAGAAPRDEAAVAADGRPPSLDVYDLSSAELLELARRCEVRWDRPPVVDGDAERLADDDATALGLTDRERTEVDRTLAAYNQRMLDQIRALYTEATGSAEADGLSPETMLSEILEKSADGEASRIFQRLSAERAGLARPPANRAAMSALERVYRLQTGAGDAFEAELAGRIGADKARGLRDHHDGFGAKSAGTFGCPH